MWKNTRHNLPKTVIVFGIVLLFAVGFMVLGIFIDIQIISKYDYTPISFTFSFLLGGVLIGLFLTLRTITHH